jgi:hypothetical protein
MNQIEFGTFMDDNNEHTEKPKFGISLTEFGIIADVNDEHPQKE